MKRTSFFAWLLIIAVLFAFITACNDSSDPGDDSENTVSETEDSPTYAEEDFGGAAFVILAPNNESYNFAIADFEEPSDDAYENAYYKRHAAVKDAVNVELKQVSGFLYGEDTVYGRFTDAVLANTGDFDMSVLNLPSACAATGNGYLLSIGEYLPEIDLDNEWWNRDCTEQLAICGNNYMISGDIFISDKECMWILYFNKALILQNGLENPFNLVDNNEWTWDKMYEMTKVATNDENGDGAVDVWGFETHDEHFAAMWQSADLKLVMVNEDGIPEIAWNTTEFSDVYEKIQTFLSDSENVKCDLNTVWSSYKDNKALFCNGVSADMRSVISQIDVETGVIPNPKYSSDIDRFVSYVAVNSCVVVFGNDTPDTYMSGVVAEAMGSLGKEIITPEYYDGQLKSRYAPCENSARMFDIIFNNRCYDLGVYYNWGGCRTSLSAKGVTNLSRVYSVLESMMEKDMHKSFENLGIY